MSPFISMLNAFEISSVISVLLVFLLESDLSQTLILKCIHLSLLPIRVKRRLRHYQAQTGDKFFHL